MRLLSVHTDHLAFEVRPGTGPDDVAETDGVPMDGEADDCVTAFLTVESRDGADVDAVVANAADELRDRAETLGTETVVLYPCAHLSDDPAGTETARAVLDGLETELEADGYAVLRAPVGRNKSLEIAARGHPHAKRSVRVSPSRDEVARADREPIQRRVVWPDGSTADAGAAVAAVDADLRRVIESGIEEALGPDAERPGFEPVCEGGFALRDDSPSGSLHWLPRGVFVRDALDEHFERRVVEYGAMPVASDGSDGDRVFPGLREAALTGDDLPVRVYDRSPRSHRHGRNEGANRLDRPRPSAEIRAVTADADAHAELLRQAELASNIAADAGVDTVPVVRSTREAAVADEAWVETVADTLGTPAVVEIVPGGSDWSVRIDLLAVDGGGRPVRYAAAQIDGESADWTDTADGRADSVDTADGGLVPSVVRCRLTRGLDRTVATVLAGAAAMDTPCLPTWLSPTQVRFVPLDDDHVPYCDGLVDELAAAGVRADVDDRPETVGDRIARAEADWVPYYAVVGDREVDGDPLPVTVRTGNTEVGTTLDELRRRVRDETEGYPRKRRYLPGRLDDHPGFGDR